MKYIDHVKVYPRHTDCYNVVWQGNYIEWFDQGRINLCEHAGLNFRKLYDNGILLPVVEMNCRYKASAGLMDELVITTELKEVKYTSVQFEQTITNKHTEQELVKAFVRIVSTDLQGKMNRKMPEFLYESFNKCINESLSKK